MKKVYLVGGAVRDALLGLPISEKDYCVVGSTPEEMIAEGYQKVGKDFPVFLNPHTKEEYALARTERKAGSGYYGFTYNAQGVTLEEDLYRRDLTINAMAQDGITIIDPYKGQLDLKNRILRHVSQAFKEDPLRVLRVARFAAKLYCLGFTIHADTIALMKELSSELKTLTPERILLETQKALLTSTPHIYFEVLQRVHALEPLFGVKHISTNLKNLNTCPLDEDLRIAYILPNTVLPVSNRVKEYVQLLQTDWSGLAYIIERKKLAQDPQKASMVKNVFKVLKMDDYARQWDKALKKIQAIDFSDIDLPPGKAYGDAKIARIQQLLDVVFIKAKT